MDSYLQKNPPSIHRKAVALLYAALLLAGCFEDRIGEIIKQENMTHDISPDGRPVPGNSGTLTESNITASSVRIDWTKASDDATPASSLQYLVFYSTGNDINSVDAAEKNGTAFGVWNTDIDTMNVTSLLGATVYYFNVIVKDGDGLKTSYVTVSATTL